MQVNFNFLQQSNNFINVAAVNRGLNRNNVTANNVNGDNRKDSVTISPQGKAMNAIKNLMSQKESIIEQRSELVTKTLESGGNLKSIEVQLDTYSKQLEEIDKQVAQITADQIKKAAEKEEEKKPEEKDENKTEQELETQKLSKLASMSNDIKDAAVVASVKSKAEGEARVKKSEIKLGRIYVDDLKTRGRIEGANVEDMINHAEQLLDSKESTVSDLQQEILNLDTELGAKLNETTDELEENRTSAPAEDEQSNASEAEKLQQ